MLKIAMTSRWKSLPRRVVSKIRHWEVLAWSWDICTQRTSPRVTITGRRERKEERMSTAASLRWDEVPAVAGVGSIQKRQQSAPPYYVFSSSPYPSFQPPCFSSRESSPPPPACYSLYYAAHPLLSPSLASRSIAPERFADVSRKISTTGSSLRALRFNWRLAFFSPFLPVAFSLHPLVLYER